MVVVPLATLVVCESIVDCARLLVLLGLLSLIALLICAASSALALTVLFAFSPLAPLAVVVRLFFGTALVEAVSVEWFSLVSPLLALYVPPVSFLMRCPRVVAFSSLTAFSLPAVLPGTLVPVSFSRVLLPPSLPCWRESCPDTFRDSSCCFLLLSFFFFFFFLSFFFFFFSFAKASSCAPSSVPPPRMERRSASSVSSSSLNASMRLSSATSTAFFTLVTGVLLTGRAPSPGLTSVKPDVSIEQMAVSSALLAGMKTVSRLSSSCSAAC